MLIDLHVHSHFSAGVEVTPEQILEFAERLGLDGVAFTERGNSRCADELVAAGAGRGVRVFVGVEIPTDKGVLLCYPQEVDAFFRCEEWRQLVAVGAASAQETIDMFRSRGGAVIAAYPYDSDVPWPMGDHIFSLEGLAAIEGYVPRLPAPRNAFAIEAASSMNLPSVGGSDYRGGDSLGIGATLFGRRVHSQAEFVEAIRDGQVWAAAVGVEIKDPSGGGERGDRGDRGERGERGDRGERSERGEHRGDRDRGGRGDRGDRGRGDRGGRGRDGGGRDRDGRRGGGGGGGGRRR